MKKLFTLSILALVTIFLLSNFTVSKEHNGQFIFMFMEEEPILPSTPFLYNDITVPNHLIEGEIDFDLGYGRGEVDTSFISEIDNDIATLGRVLFYDKKLSALETISCASCHNQASSFADNKALSEGVNTDTRRNSMQLNDIAWTDNNHFFWDMSETDIREMIRLPLKDENEIGLDMDEVAIKLSNTSYYPELFSNAFNSTEISEDKIVEALIQFMESMTTFNSRFDQVADNDLTGITDQELLGLEIFGFFCSECHMEGDRMPLLGFEPSDEMTEIEAVPFFFNNGLPLNDNDLGAGEWNNDFDHLFKIPTLRNVELTGPYMHDGSIETLEEVVEFYSEETIANEWSFLIPDGGYRFVQEEKDALVAFLKMLTDDTFISDVKFSDPFDLTNTIEEKTLFKVVVKPNPMGDFSIIEFEANADEETQISILNSVGQELMNETIKGNTYRLSKADFIAGIYYLNFKRGNKTSSQKLIVH